MEFFYQCCSTALVQVSRRIEDVSPDKSIELRASGFRSERERKTTPFFFCFAGLFLSPLFGTFVLRPDTLRILYACTLLFVVLIYVFSGVLSLSPQYLGLWSIHFTLVARLFCTHIKRAASLGRKDEALRPGRTLQG